MFCSKKKLNIVPNKEIEITTLPCTFFSSLANTDAFVLLLSLRSLSLLLLLLLVMLFTVLVANAEMPATGLVRLGLFVVVFVEPLPDAVAGDAELLALRMLLMYDVRLGVRNTVTCQHGM